MVDAASGPVMVNWNVALALGATVAGVMVAGTESLTHEPAV